MHISMTVTTAEGTTQMGGNYSGIYTALHDARKSCNMRSGDTIEVWVARTDSAGDAYGAFAWIAPDDESNGHFEKVEKLERK